MNAILNITCTETDRVQGIWTGTRNVSLGDLPAMSVIVTAGPDVMGHCDCGADAYCVSPVDHSDAEALVCAKDLS